VKLLAPDKMLERLERSLPMLTGGARDLPERQRTLRATIGWSYELLTPAEQRLFARLSAFRGGATLEAIEAVAGADLDTLQSLVDKSLVRRRADRFVMLETIREFAVEVLEASGEGDDLRRRHAEFFVALAHEAEPHLRLDEIEWLDRLEAEQDNLRAVLDRLETAGDTQGVIELAGALQRFWYLKSHLAEGRRRYERALAADPRPTAARAKALRGASVMALNLGGSGPTQSKAWAEEALALDTQLGDAWGAAYSTMMIGNALGEEGDLAAAVPFLEQAMSAFEKLGDELYALVSMFNLAWMVDELGDRPRGRALHEDSLRRARAIGNVRMEAGALTQLALYARDEGRLEEAQTMQREAIRIEHARGQLVDVGIDLARLASMVGRAGRAHEAALLLGASASIAESIGTETPWWNVRRNEETIVLLRERLSQEEFDAAIEEGRRLTVDEAVALALGPEEPVAQ
jgi:tetratricopeptide (TPR) repeat protein